jgi:D-glycero-alpha-D-manno-heptose-7-phosphate kinase
MAFMTRTPLRVSLFGGGTDYPEYYQRRPGAVVGFAIQKYIFLTALRLQARMNYSHRISYSKLEFTDRVEDIEHPVIRNVLADMGLNCPLDLNVLCDLPSSGGGLGSSSAFTVGMINLVASIQQLPMTKMDLALAAIRMEREVLRERVGVQDQLHAAFGGVNRFDFEGGRFKISPVQLTAASLRAINDSLVLIYTGIARRATQVVAEQVKLTAEKKLDVDLGHLYEMVGEGVTLLETGGKNLLNELGRRLNESWTIKRSLSSSISTDEIDRIFDTAAAVGAYGGKLCGAGGGGFIMMLCPREKQRELARRLHPLTVLPTAVDVHGTTLLYRDHGDLAV